MGCTGTAGSDGDQFSTDALCGNGIVEFGEQCDLGDDNSDAVTARCTTSCRLASNASALTPCEDDANCTTVRVEGTVTGLPVARVRAEVGDFTTEVDTDPTGFYAIEIDIVDETLPLTLIATSDVPRFSAVNFMTSYGSAGSVLGLAVSGRVTSEESRFVSINAISTAAHIAGSLNGANLASWNGADRRQAEWQLGFEINAQEMIDLAAILNGLAKEPELSTSFTSTLDLLGNPPVVNALLSEFEETEALSTMAESLFEEFLLLAGPFPGLDRARRFVTNQVLSGPVVPISNSTLQLSADGSGASHSPGPYGTVRFDSLGWTEDNGALSYTLEGSFGFRQLSFEEIRLAYADASEAVRIQLSDIANDPALAETVAAGVLTPITSTTTSSTVLFSGQAQIIVLSRRTLGADLATAMSNAFGVDLPERTLSVPGFNSIENLLDIDVGAGLPVPDLSGQTFVSACTEKPCELTSSDPRSPTWRSRMILRFSRTVPGLLAGRIGSPQ
ncbi:MAG: hypothetical protein AAFQ82_06680 [Myxococcota bacterium]